MGKKSSHKKQRQAPAAKPVKQAAAPARMPMELSSLTKEGFTPAADAQVRPVAFGEQTQYIRADIKRIGTLLIVVAVLLAGSVIWNSKSASIFNAGKRMASFMQLQH